MPAGLEVLNDYGTYLIDGTNIAPYLIAKGTGTTRGADYSPHLNPYYQKITLPSDTELCVVRCPDKWIHYSIGKFEGVVSLWVETHGAASFTYYAFKYGQHPGAGFGMEVFSPTGQLIFTSAAKMLGIVSSRLFNFSSTTLSRESGRVYAQVIGFPRAFETRDGAGNTYGEKDAMHYNESTGVVTRGVFNGSTSIVSTNTSWIDSVSGGYPTMMNVDITNL